MRGSSAQALVVLTTPLLMAFDYNVTDVGQPGPVAAFNVNGNNVAVAAWDAGFIASWSDHRESFFSRTAVWRFDVVGQPFGPSAVISSSDLYETDHTIACNQGSCVIAYATPQGVKARRIDPTTGAFGPAFLTSLIGYPSHLVASSTGSGYLLSGRSPVAVVPLNSDGQPTGPNVTIFSGVRPSRVAAHDGGFAVSANASTGGSVYVWPRGPTGADGGPAIWVGNTNQDHGQPCLSSWSGGFIVGYSDGTSRLSFRRLTTDGVAIDATEQFPFGGSTSREVECSSNPANELVVSWTAPDNSVRAGQFRVADYVVTRTARVLRSPNGQVLDRPRSALMGDTLLATNGVARGIFESFEIQASAGLAPATAEGRRRPNRSACLASAGRTENFWWWRVSTRPMAAAAGFNG